MTTDWHNIHTYQGVSDILSLSDDCARIHSIVNHPDVRPYVGPGDDDLNLSEVINRPENWFLIGEHGGFGLIWSAPGVHEVHTFILKSGRGRWAVDAAHSMIEYAATHDDFMLWTKIKPVMRNVIHYAIRMGIMPTRMTIDTFGEPYGIYKMRIGQCL